MQQAISVIIPCYNDSLRIGDIIAEVKKSPFVAEIIVVDDGSNAATKHILSQLSGIHLITHKTNFGKSNSLLSGVKKATSNSLLFMDADLKNITHSHINQLVHTFFAGNYDMLLGYRERDAIYMRWIGFAQAYTGERLIRKSLLLDHLELFQVPGYLIEPSINQLFFRHYRVGGIELSQVSHLFKIQKYGLPGLFGDWKMYGQFIKQFGVQEILFQMRFAKRLHSAIIQSV